MEFKEIVELVNILTEMSLDTYMRCKYTILAACKHDGSLYFFTKLFALVDKRRPKLLEMKGGVTV